MHELSLASELVDRCLAAAAGRPVASVRVRIDPGTDAAALRQGFDASAAGTALEGARLDIDVPPQLLACACGFDGKLGSDDVVGHMTVCPACGAVAQARGLGGIDMLAVHLRDRQPG
jgi:hydrogenase nickel incorporation protein HypA/HybF